MPISSRWAPPIPAVSLPTWIFSHPTASLPPSIANKPAYVDTERPSTHTLTFSAFRLLTKRLGLGLSSHPAIRQHQSKDESVNVGPRVLVVANNSIFFPVAMLGVIAAGCVFTGASPAFKAGELAYQLTDSGATIMIAGPEMLETAVTAAKEANMDLANVYVLDHDEANMSSTTTSAIKPWTHLLANEPLAEAWSWHEPKHPHDTICCLNYSSGTTGLPKGVEITHGAYVANGIGATHAATLAPGYEASLARRANLCCLPLYHVFPQTSYVANAPHIGVTTYILGGGPRFDLARMLGAVERFRVTHLALVPPILTAIAKAPVARRYDLSSVEHISCGAAPLGSDVAHGAQAVVAAAATVHRKNNKKPTPPALPPVVLRQGWGMTEMTCTGLTWSFDTASADIASVGELSPNCRAKLVSVADGEEITTPRVPGELWITGPSMMRGYWKNAAATAESIVVEPPSSSDSPSSSSDTTTATRWLRTGDVAFIDGGPNGSFASPGGLFYIVDRVKELIKVKGRQVAPAELEAVLLGHENVADAAVVGVVVGGEEMPRAYVVMRPSPPTKLAVAVVGEDEATERDVAAWVAGRVARYKRLNGGVVFVKEIPKTPSGKILRRALRARAALEIGDREPPESRLA